MLPRRITLIAAMAAMVALSIWLPRGRAAGAATAPGGTAGELDLVNRKGEPAGVCPLRHTDVTADISGYVARVTVKQEFVNPSNQPMEAIYNFPLPSDAAVDDMTMTIGARVIHGDIKRKEEAFGIYTAAKAAGQSAALLDQERPNIFTQQVANITPGAKIVVTISYVNMLKYQDGQYEFVYPMVVGERYIPGDGYTAAGQRGQPVVPSLQGDPGAAPVVLDAHRITPPIAPQGTRAGHDISVKVRLDAGLPLQSVTCSSHDVMTRPIGSSGAVVTLQNQQTIPNKDFILHYSAAGSETVEGLLAYAPAQAAAAGSRDTGPAGGYFTLVVQPPIAPPKEQISPKEMVFVIDQTGSQSGWPIAKAKETMRYCIANMNSGDTFQLIGFNTDVYPCFKQPVPNTPDNVAAALKFLEPLEGNGGTNILKSIDYALNIPDDPDRLRIVCYMTDGYVGNDMQILDYIQKHRGRARMFPFGIGNSVNRFLIEGMAREGCGAPEYVAVNTNAGAQFGGDMPAGGVKGAKDVAERFYRRIASPLLLDVHVDWNGLPVEDVYPRQIPDLFSAGPITIKGRYSRAAEGNITVRGLLRGKPWSRTIHVSLPSARSEGSVISTLWARERIEDLQSQDWLGAQTNSPKPDIHEQIVRTALEYHLMSQYTSFVAVEQRVVNVGGKQRTVDVPVEIPDGVSYASFMPPNQSRGANYVPFSAGFGGGGGTFGKKSGALAGRLGSVPAPPANFSVAAGTAPAQQSKELLTLGDGERHSAEKVPAARTDLRGLTAPGNRTSTLSKDETNSFGIMVRKTATKRKDGLSRDDGERRIAALKPEERRTVLEKAKLAPDLVARMDAFHKDKGAKAELVQIEVWLADAPPDAQSRLKSIGFKLDGTLTPGRLLLGSIPINKLDDLLSLAFVRRVEPPKFE